MKKIILIAILILSGCAAKFTIPDEPTYRNLQVYQLESGVCLDNQGWATLQTNIMSMKNYGDKLRGILEGLK